MGWHRFTKPYRFQMYNSTKHHLHTASCACCPKQRLFPSQFSPTLYPPSPTPTSLSLWLSLHCCLCLCVTYICFLPNPFTFFHLVPQAPKLKERENWTAEAGLSPLSSRRAGLLSWELCPLKSLLYCQCRLDNSPSIYIRCVLLLTVTKLLLILTVNWWFWLP